MYVCTYTRMLLLYQQVKCDLVKRELLHTQCTDQAEIEVMFAVCVDFCAVYSTVTSSSGVGFVHIAREGQAS